MKLVSNVIAIEFDSYKCIPDKNIVLLYRDKENIECVPHITVDAEMLSDYGKNVIEPQEESEE